MWKFDNVDSIKWIWRKIQHLTLSKALFVSCALFIYILVISSFCWNFLENKCVCKIIYIFINLFSSYISRLISSLTFSMRLFLTLFHLRSSSRIYLFCYPTVHCVNLSLLFSTLQLEGKDMLINFGISRTLNLVVINKIFH